MALKFKLVNLSKAHMYDTLWQLNAESTNTCETLNLLSLENSFLRLLFSKEEFRIFGDIVEDVSAKFQSIIGVLLTGTLTQEISLPSPDNFLERNSGLIYKNVIARMERRKIAPHPDSDLDLWICTENPDDSDRIIEEVEERSYDLIYWLSKNLELHGSDKWIELKRAAFIEYYKNSELYLTSELGGPPWLAKNFTHEIISMVTTYLPSMKEKIDFFFRKGWTENFIETRAYPSCVFNLRPEKIYGPNGNVLDRSPFGFFIKDWVDLERNCMVLYRNLGSNENDIYPINPRGRLLGENILGF